MFKAAKKIFGTKNDRVVKGLYKTVSQINKLEAQFKVLSDEDLVAMTAKFKQDLAQGKTLTDILPEAFAVCREASVRVLGMRHFDVQLIGGMVLHQGQIAEMKTGEGKTLTATLAVYLNALAGKGVHVITVNDYLARRDAEWMGKLYRFLGLTTGVILHGIDDRERREAYHADVTYGTNNEFGFDYLRDNMKIDVERMVQREPYFCIIDEVDSILIDEARTPLIISGPTDSSTDDYYTVNRVIPGLQKDSDYIVDEKSHTSTLTEDGVEKMERRLRVENLYDPKYINLLHHVEQALKAHFLFKKDVDYVVRDGQVLIVDEHTGRLMPGRRYSDGLHGALEAKEHLTVQTETQTMASITFQNLFRMYDKLSGMTGTADTEAVEFKKIYNLDVVVIPTNKPLVRDDQPDKIYRTAREKFNAIADEIASIQKTGQPVLVGTISVERSELLSSLLTKRGTPHEILNAKNHAREAEIIKSAGAKGHVTLSTNMAGRGTDIVLGEGVLELGGLCVLGTERHESRRIDNQLRGRAGRQGDPGRTVFYLSLEDDLMRLFASDRLKTIMGRLGMKEGESIVSPMVTRAIERAQKRVEERHFSSRKNLIEYDDVMNQQRQVVYKRRNGLLRKGENVDFIEDVTRVIVEDIISKNSPEATNEGNWKFENISELISTEFQTPIKVRVDKPEEDITTDVVVEEATKALLDVYAQKEAVVGQENMQRVERYVYLQVIDSSWKDHLLSMDQLRDSVGLRAHGQRDPLQEYKKEAFRYFETFISRIEDEAVLALHRMPPPEERIEIESRQEELDSLNYQHPNADSAPQSTNSSTTNLSKSNGSSPARSRQGPSDEPRVDTFVREQPKLGRNDPCFCGSGKKYKKCHGMAGAAQQPQA